MNTTNKATDKWLEFSYKNVLRNIWENDGVQALCSFVAGVSGFVGMVMLLYNAFSPENKELSPLFVMGTFVPFTIGVVLVTADVVAEAISDEKWRVKVARDRYQK